MGKYLSTDKFDIVYNIFAFYFNLINSVFPFDLFYRKCKTVDIKKCRKSVDVREKL